MGVIKKVTSTGTRMNRRNFVNLMLTVGYGRRKTSCDDISLHMERGSIREGMSFTLRHVFFPCPKTRFFTYDPNTKRVVPTKPEKVGLTATEADEGPTKDPSTGKEKPEVAAISESSNEPDPTTKEDPVPDAVEGMMKMIEEFQKEKAEMKMEIEEFQKREAEKDIKIAEIVKKDAERSMKIEEPVSKDAEKDMKIEELLKENAELKMELKKKPRINEDVLKENAELKIELEKERRINEDVLKENAELKMELEKEKRINKNVLKATNNEFLVRFPDYDGSLDTLEKILKELAVKFSDEAQHYPQLESDLEKINNLIQNNSVYIERKRQEEAQWENEAREMNEKCLEEMREIIKKEFLYMKQEDLNKEFPEKPALAKRVFRKKEVFKVFYLTQEKLASLHATDLSQKHDPSGLDLTELRAFYACLPKVFKCDTDGSKMRWKDKIKLSLKEMQAKEKNGSLSALKKRNAAYRVEIKKNKPTATASARPLTPLGGGNMFAELKARRETMFGRVNSPATESLQKSLKEQINNQQKRPNLMDAIKAKAAKMNGTGEPEDKKNISAFHQTKESANKQKPLEMKSMLTQIREKAAMMNPSTCPDTQKINSAIKKRPSCKPKKDKKPAAPLSMMEEIKLKARVINKNIPAGETAPVSRVPPASTNTGVCAAPRRVRAAPKGLEAIFASRVLN